jgi:3-phosphoshikimate 1-carboxyvinyltransferase
MKLISEPLQQPLAGQLRPPGDKSISHRAVILASLANGESTLHGVLPSEDVTATRLACEQLGAHFEITRNAWRVHGTGRTGLLPPLRPLDMGNSGTAMRLLAGVLSGQVFDSVLSGDASLSKRPMNRIIEPLREMGADIAGTETGTAPLQIHGNPNLEGRAFELTVASAQLKSCLLLAGIFANGETSVTEPLPTRDHTERMLPVFGVELTSPRTLCGPARLHAAELDIPADPSSAAFVMAAAAMVKGSGVTLQDVGLNPGRTGFFRCLDAMGADIKITQASSMGDEPVGEINVLGGKGLHGIDVPAEWVPSMIDEMPVLMALAATATGTTRIRGAQELRVKESDRIAVMAHGLGELGVEVKEYPDGMDIHGGKISGGTVETHMDHRCAMSFALLGMLASTPVTVLGAEFIDTSFPGFADMMNELGARMHEAESSDLAGIN